MKNSGVIIITVLLVGCIDSLLLCVHHRNKQEQKEYVSLPSAYLYIGIAFLIFSVFPFIGTWSGENLIFYDPICCLFLAMDFLMIIMCINQVNWRIYPLETTMIHRNFIGVKKEISYDQIKKIQHLKSGDTLLWIKGKKIPIVIDKYAFGLETLIALYNRYYLKKQKKS